MRQTATLTLWKRRRKRALRSCGAESNHSKAAHSTKSDWFWNFPPIHFGFACKKGGSRRVARRDGRPVSYGVVRATEEWSETARLRARYGAAIPPERDCPYPDPIFSGHHPLILSPDYPLLSHPLWPPFPAFIISLCLPLSFDSSIHLSSSSTFVFPPVACRVSLLLPDCGGS